MIRKALFKPPSRDRRFWLMMIVGLTIFVLAAFESVFNERMRLAFSFLAVQFILLSTAELLMKNLAAAAWLRGLSLLAGISTAVAVFYGFYKFLSS